MKATGIVQTQESSQSRVLFQTRLDLTLPWDLLAQALSFPTINVKAEPKVVWKKLQTWPNSALHSSPRAELDILGLSNDLSRQKHKEVDPSSSLQEFSDSNLCQPCQTDSAKVPEQILDNPNSLLSFPEDFPAVLISWVARKKEEQLPAQAGGHPKQGDIPSRAPSPAGQNTAQLHKAQRSSSRQNPALV